MADDSYEFDALPAERQKLLLDWILHNLKPIKSINPKSGSGQQHSLTSSHAVDESALRYGSTIKSLSLSAIQLNSTAMV